MIRLRDFEPIGSVGNGANVSFRARSRATGAPLMVHLFRGTGLADGERVLALLPRFPPAERYRILDFAQDHEAVFFLTLDLPGNLGFLEWIESLFSQPVPRPPAEIESVKSEPLSHDISSPFIVQPHALGPRPVPIEAHTARAMNDLTSFGIQQTITLSDSGKAPGEGIDDLCRRMSPGDPASFTPSRASNGNPFSEPRGRDEIPPLFVGDELPPVQGSEPYLRPPLPPHQNSAHLREPARPYSGLSFFIPSLMPWLVTVGITLGAALFVIAICEYFGLA